MCRLRCWRRSRMRFLLLLLKRRLSKSLRSRGALSCGARWISRRSSWPSCLSRWRLWLKSTLMWLKRWWRSKPSLRNWRWNWKKLVGSSCNLRTRPLRHLRKPRGERSQTSSGGHHVEAPCLQQVLAAQETFSWNLSGNVTHCWSKK